MGSGAATSSYVAWGAQYEQNGKVGPLHNRSDTPYGCSFAKFPVEIIFMILGATCDNDGLYNIDETTHLSLVCKRWRKFFIGKPAMWNNIDVFRRNAREFIIRSDLVQVHISAHMISSYGRDGKPNWRIQKSRPLDSDRAGLGGFFIAVCTIPAGISGYQPLQKA